MVTAALSGLPVWFGVCVGVIRDRLRRTRPGCRGRVSIRAREGGAASRVSGGGEDAAERGQDKMTR
jgi:hypothetical protein